jgi:hypothetical protein
MKTISYRPLLLGALALLVLAPSSFAQRQLGKKKGPTAKIYIADVKGDGQIENGEKIYTLRQSTAFDAPGSVIETKAGSHNAIVYSNGTGMFVDESTRVEIERFTQQPFQPNGQNALDSNYEPSMSQSDVFLSHGAVGICTNQLLSGSSMIYSTSVAGVNIRGGKLVIEAHPDETYVDLLEGDVTVRSTGKDVGGKVLRAGERAVIRPASAPGLEPIITIMPIPQEARKKDDERVELACSARKSVTFEAIALSSEENADDNEAAGADGTDQEIVIKPVVPAQPPINVVISPDRLPGT